MKLYYLFFFSIVNSNADKSLCETNDKGDEKTTNTNPDYEYSPCVCDGDGIKKAW
jgi:hypothetical protein